MRIHIILPTTTYALSAQHVTMNGAVQTPGTASELNDGGGTTSLLPSRAMWDKADGQMDVIVRAMLQNIEDMQQEYARLRQAYQQLQREHDEMHSKYATDKENWRTFKTWWTEKLKDKRTKYGGGDGGGSSSGSSSNVADTAVRTPVNHLSTNLHLNGKAPTLHGEQSSPSTSVLSNKRKTARSLQSGEQILRNVGLPFEPGSKDDANGALPTPSRGPQLFTPLPAAAQSTSRSAMKRSLLSNEVDKAGSPSISNTHSEGALRDLTNKTSPDKTARHSTNTTKEYGSTSKHNTATASTEKGKRRKTINAEFELDPKQNGDIPYLHKEVVRGKDKRKHMHAYDCECCKDWYDAVGPVAVRPYEDVGRSKDGAAAATDDDEFEDDSTTVGDKSPSTTEKAQRQEHLQRTSRHRAFGPQPPTPPGFWEISFPTTQRVEELNRSAEVAERQRRERIENDPRFRRRQNQ